MSLESTPSAQELHEVLVKTDRLGRVVKRKFLRALAVMAVSRLYRSLGFSSIVGYADRCFGLSRAITHEYLRVDEGPRGVAGPGACVQRRPGGLDRAAKPSSCCPKRGGGRISGEALTFSFRGR
jgi:hypothetical protein